MPSPTPPWQAQPRTARASTNDHGSMCMYSVPPAVAVRRSSTRSPARALTAGGGRRQILGGERAISSLARPVRPALPCSVHTCAPAPHPTLPSLPLSSQAPKLDSAKLPAAVVVSSHHMRAKLWPRRGVAAEPAEGGSAGRGCGVSTGTNADSWRPRSRRLNPGGSMWPGCAAAARWCTSCAAMPPVSPWATSHGSTRSPLQTQSCTSTTATDGEWLAAAAVVAVCSGMGKVSSAPSTDM